jgi:hypothetical protein
MGNQNDMTEAEIIEVEMDQARQAIKDRDALLALEKSPNFKRIIKKRYIDEESTRLVLLKVSNLNADQMANVDKMMCGISALNHFFQGIIAKGDEMEQAINDFEKERDMAAEEAI